MNLDETIVAVSTPPGRGGLGVVRLSGPGARSIAKRVLKLAADHEWQPWQRRARRVARRRGPRRRPGHRHLLRQAPLLHRRGRDRDLLPWLAGGPAPLCSKAPRGRRRPAGRARRVHAARLRQWPHRSAAGRGRARPDRCDHALPGPRRGPAGRRAVVSRRIAAAQGQQLLELIALLEAGIDFAEDDLERRLQRGDPPTARSHRVRGGRAGR